MGNAVWFNIGKLGVMVEAWGDWRKPWTWGWPALQRGGSSKSSDWVLFLGPLSLCTEHDTQWRQDEEAMNAEAKALTDEAATVA